MPQASRTFRLFVSSTFSDLKAERNALQERVFPRLRALAEAHRCRFQAIDLRWGISDEAALDQQTMKICLDEIARCQKTSPRPNFIILLGNRYGWKPIPFEIPEDEFQRIILQISTEEKELLGHWYRCDENAIPPIRCLQPRSGDYTVYKTWEKVETRLHYILEKAAQQLKLPEERLLKYCASATEQEIFAGALRAPDAPDHVFCYFRELGNLPNNEHGAGYIDLTSENKFDQSCSVQLIKVKEILKNKLPNHIRSYPSRWTDQGPTLNHLDELCNQVYKDLETVILEEIQFLEVGKNILEMEILAHQDFGSLLTVDFTGRKDILQEVANYLESDNNAPFVIYGQSGCGKSALMSRAAEKAKEKGGNDLAYQMLINLRGMDKTDKHKQTAAIPEIFSRFVGVTPESCTGRGILESICHQISFEYDLEDSPLPTSFNALTKEFLNRLSYATEQRPIFIFLDALDQLSLSESANTLAWLPIKLPENVKIVISILPDEVKKSLESRLPAGNFLEMGPMSLDEGEDLLDAWLERHQRTMQANQKELVINGFAKNGLPLYLKLAFQEASRWRSFDPLPKIKSDVPGMIHDMFDRLSLQINHGPLLVSKCLGYLASARMGLSEDEILDVLALDDEFFTDVQIATREHGHELEARSVPVVLWSRLYLDLEPYLSSYIADGSQLIGFYHRQVGEVAADIYLTADKKSSCHARLSRYFESKTLSMDGKPNLRKLSELPYQQTYGELWDEINRTLCDLNFIETKCKAGMTYDLVMDYDRLGAGRSLPGAPVVYPRKNQGNYRIRCPFCLGTTDLLGSELGQVNRCSHCKQGSQVTSFSHEGRWEKCGPQRSVRQLTEFDTSHLLEKTAQFADFIFDQAHILSVYPGLCLQQAANQPDQTAPAIETRKILSTDKKKRNWLRWINKPQQRSACLMTLDEHKGYVTACAFSPDGSLLISTGDDKTLRVWETATGKQRSIFRGHKDTTMCCAFSPNGDLVVSGSADNTLKIWDVSSGVERFTLSGHNNWVVVCAFSPDGKEILSEDKYGGTCIWDTASGKEKTTSNGVWGTTEQTFPLAGEKRAISPDGKLWVSGFPDGTIKILDVSTGQELAVLVGHKLNGRASGHVSQSEQILSCAFNMDGKIFATSSFDHTVKIWDTETKRELATLKGHTDWVRCCCFSPDGRLIVSGSGDGTIKLWNLVEAIQNQDEKTTPLVAHTDQTLACDISPDGRSIISGSLDNTLKLWESSTGRLVKTLEGHTGGVTTCVFNPDKRHILSGSNDKSVRMWDIFTGREVGRFDGAETPIRSCVFHTNGKYLVSAATGGRITLLDSSNLKQIIEFDTPPFLFVCAIHPDGTTIASAGGGGMVCLWDLEELFQRKQNGSRITPVKLEGHDIDFDMGDWGSGEPSGIYCLAFSPDGNFLLTGGSDSTLILWDFTARRQVRSYTGHTSWVRTCAFSPDGEQFISGGNDNTLRLWQLKTGEVIAMFPAPGIISCARISPVENVYCCTDVGGCLTILALESGAPLGFEEEWTDVEETLPVVNPVVLDPIKENEEPHVKKAHIYNQGTLIGHNDVVTSLGFSQDGKWLISGSSDSSVRAWNMMSGHEERLFFQANANIAAVAISPDKLNIFAISQKANTTDIYNWDVAQVRLVNWLQDQYPIGFTAFSSDCTKVLLAFNQTILIWDILENMILKDLTPDSHMIKTVALTPDGKNAALGCDDNTLRVWDLEQVVEKIRVEYQQPIKVVALTPDAKTAILATADGVINVWDVENRCQIFKFQNTSTPPSALSVSLETWQLLAVWEHGEFLIWDLKDGTLIHSGHMDCSIISCAINSKGTCIAIGDNAGIIHVFYEEGLANQILSTALERSRIVNETSRISTLIEQLKDDRELVRNEAIEVLKDYKDNDTVDAIGALLKHKSKTVREAAFETFRRIRTRHAAEVTIQAVKIGYEEVKNYVTIVLSTMGSISYEPLVSALTDEDSAVRGIASQLIRIYIHMDGGVENFVSKGYPDKDEKNHQEVIEYLRKKVNY